MVVREFPCESRSLPGANLKTPIAIAVGVFLCGLNWQSPGHSLIGSAAAPLHQNLLAVILQVIYSFYMPISEGELTIWKDSIIAALLWASERSANR